MALSLPFPFLSPWLHSPGAPTAGRRRRTPSHCLCVLQVSRLVHEDILVLLEADAMLDPDRYH